jgi:hypothetical protein
MDIGTDFNKFDFKRCGVNFIQVFVVGYITIFLLLFAWSATSEYGLKKTIDDISVDLLLSPIFWYVPFLMAMIVAVIRGVRRVDIDVNDPKQLDEYLKSRKLKNQPRWFKVFGVLFIALFIYSLFAPDNEIADSQYKTIESILTNVKSEELQSVYERISSDQIITASEYSEFINKSLSIEIGESK